MRFNSKPRSRPLSRLSDKLTGIRYRPSPNRTYTVNQPTGHPGQMMYPTYGGLPLQHHQQSQHQQQHQPQAHAMQQVSRPSPPQPTWAVPQTQHPYYQMQKPPMTATRDDSQQLMARPDTHSPAMSTATFRHELGAPQTLGPTDYFPGVIDTSTSYS